MPEGVANISLLRSGVRVSVLSIAWTMLASTVAILIGASAANLALFAFGCIGLLDAVGSVALVIHFRHALMHQTFSEPHERVAFLIVTGGLVGVALATIFESLSRLVTRTHGGQTVAGIGVAAVSVVVLGALSRRKIAVGLPSPVRRCSLTACFRRPVPCWRLSRFSEHCSAHLAGGGLIRLRR